MDDHARRQEKLIEALVALEGNPDWEVVVEFYEKELDTGTKCLIQCEDISTLRQQQGKAQAYERFVERARGARALLNQMKAKKQRR